MIETLKSLLTALSCASIIEDGIVITSFTPKVFCAVIAVTTVEA